jgi:hypothetical protein
VSDLATKFYETWLGMVQPVDGLVVSVPVLVDAQCMERQPPATQHKLLDLCPELGKENARTISSLPTFLAELLGLTPELFDAADALPDALSLYVPEGGQTLRPTIALRKLDFDDEHAEPVDAVPDDSTEASHAGRPYYMLVWQLPDGLAFDKPETQTGPWPYPPGAKFDRLLREVRVPIGLLVNGEAVRLYYCPHGESTGAMTFRIADMAEVGGRPILDAFVMLLGAQRWFGVAKQYQLPRILRDSRERQVNVTNALAEQVFDALDILLQGFAAAAERDGEELLLEALRREDDHLYGGLLTVLLRLVFVLYAEDRGLLPTEHAFYGKHLSVLGLFEELQADHGAFPDTMGRRFGAWPRLVALFRAVYFGVNHGEMSMPPRRGALFDPKVYPFLEGWGPAGGAPVSAEARAAVRVPSVSDAAVFGMLEKLLLLEGQRLSYRALEVEQIGSVYERLMGYHVRRVTSPSVCLRGSKSNVWVAAADVLEVKPGSRPKWLEGLGFTKAQAGKIAAAWKRARDTTAVVEALEKLAIKGARVAGAGAFVIQPGEERRRTSSHYTPRSLSEPIVRRTLEPLLAAMDPKGEPSSEKLLRLKVCDPAMGSGAFLVAACRFLGDQVVAAWTREGSLREIVDGHEDPVVHARRLVAQRCLYGVDKNPSAVHLAKLSLWLETLSKDEPFTFVDHALKCGDSLVGLSLQQIKRFEWTPDTATEGTANGAGKKKGRRSAGDGRQLGLFDSAIERVLLAAYRARRKLLELAEAKGDHAAHDVTKARLHAEAEEALERARLIGDALVGAFFAHTKDRAREEERARRLAVITDWLQRGGDAPAAELVLGWIDAIRAIQRPFHWPLEFPEVFWDERPDPLDADEINHAALVDAFFGNPPFMGGRQVTATQGDDYSSWLAHAHGGSKAADYSAHFFLRADALLGAQGTIGLIATDTISQGDTRTTGLQPLLRSGLEIYDAVSSQPWPGEASVSVAIVHLAKGTARLPPGRPRRLDGRVVERINSRLRAGDDRPDPARLRENDRLCFQGSNVLGLGFVLTPEEARPLLDTDPRNAEVLRPYIGGDEVNSSPIHDFRRYVIDFKEMTEAKARGWPRLWKRLEDQVKPERATKDAKKYPRMVHEWWKFWNSRQELYETIRPLERCLVTGLVSRHLMFSFQPTDRVFSHKLGVFAIADHARFGVLQSRVHEAWARLLSSTFGGAALNYSPTDCFETFPFPRDLDALESVGERLYTARAAYMVDTDQGLTKTYNALEDPRCDDPRILELRDRHLEMDRAVLSAYGWSRLEPPPYADPTTAAEQAQRQGFEDQVLDRIFALNAERAAEESRVGPRAGRSQS